ncbi:hypothetical protein CP965_04635 [Halarcobacter mediterraneus]|uniref:Cytochrome C oxidase subunit I n=1 Tax=Halarcobacter mediterraneus TaxID=2023153 RepID=A0A4Q1ATA0_9BACT|nr:hypothetical protein [Halarcobacter mediterraneus]RXK13092.1 hypothetical protein CP965_04635 [Halarcobacter mediterraneus]
MNISTAFAPPFKLVAPFFVLGVMFFLISILLMFGSNLETLHYLNSSTLAWVHIFLLSFVMLIILGAMAQLVPVVLEVGHCAVDLYYAIYPLVIVGTTLMAFGFYSLPILLPFGGTAIFIAMSIFLIETFLTILKVKKINFIIGTIIISNIFLLLGLIVGIVLALNHSGIISVDSFKLLKAHIFLVFFGYVGTTIMSMSLILLPMFWLSHSFSWLYVKSAFYILCSSIISMLIFSFLNINIFEMISYILCIISLLLYFVQIFVIYKKRVRVEVDIYFKSMVFSYFSLIISLIFLITYLFYENDNLLISASWLILVGFIGFLIAGHLYKIVPFLVWYERFSMFVGKKQVPMLNDLIPKKSSNFQFIMSSIGIIIVTIGLLTNISEIYKSGLCFLTIGVIFLLKDILYMANIKEESYVF